MGSFSRLAEFKPQRNYSSTAVIPPVSVYRYCCHNANLRRHTINTNTRDTPEGIPCRTGRLEADHGYVKHPSCTNDKRARWFVSKRVNAFGDIDTGTGGLLRNHNLLENLLDVIARDWKSRSVVHEETNREWGSATSITKSYSPARTTAFHYTSPRIRARTLRGESRRDRELVRRGQLDRLLGARWCRGLMTRTWRGETVAQPRSS